MRTEGADAPYLKPCRVNCFSLHPQHHAFKASPANNLLIVLTGFGLHEHGNSTVGELPWPQIVPWKSCSLS
jgi:hypothetical protein